MLINNYEATLILSQAHAKPNKKEILGAFVTLIYLFKSLSIIKS